MWDEHTNVSTHKPTYAHSGADCWNNLSLGDTSTKIGTQVLQNSLFQKSTLANVKKEMAAIFQDGRRSYQYETVFALNIVKVMTFWWSVHQNVCSLTWGIEFCNQNVNVIKRYSDMMTVIWTSTFSVKLSMWYLKLLWQKHNILQQTEVTCLDLTWIIVLFFAFTATQLCALQGLATFTRATIFCQLQAGLSNGWEVWPENFPGFTFSLPAPVARTFRLHCTFCWLAPYASNLEFRSSNMLSERCSSWWNGVIGSLLPTKQVQSCLINLGSAAVFVIQSENKFLEWWDQHLLGGYRLWVCWILGPLQDKLPMFAMKLSSLYLERQRPRHSQWKHKRRACHCICLGRGSSPSHELGTI